MFDLFSIELSVFINSSHTPTCIRLTGMYLFMMYDLIVKKSEKKRNKSAGSDFLFSDVI